MFDTVVGIALQGCVFGCLLRPLQPDGQHGSRRSARQTRAKNILDRLKEETSRKLGRPRKDSESSEFAPAKEEVVLRRIQQIKWAKESALKEEDWASEYGSVLNSVQTLNQPDSGGAGDVVGNGVGYKASWVSTDNGQKPPPPTNSGVYGISVDGSQYAVSSRALHDVAEKDELIAGIINL